MKQIKLSKGVADCIIHSPSKGLYVVAMINAEGTYGYRWYPGLTANFEDIRKAKRYAMRLLNNQNSWVI